MPARRPHKRRCGGLARPCTEIAAVLCCCTYNLKALVENLNVTLTRHFTVGVTGFEPAIFEYPRVDMSGQKCSTSLTCKEMPMVIRNHE
jgi:hypothetical protein